MPRPASSSSEVPLTVDRSGGERDDETLLERVLAEPRTLALAVRRDVAPVRDGRLALIAPAQLAKDHVRAWAFLGRTPDGTAVVLAVLTDDAPDDLIPDAEGTPLRAAGGDLPAGEAELLTTAVALAGWLRDAAFCPACGSATELRHAGWSRHCPVCGREHFPRTDPAVIVLVTSATSDDRILLGANAAWGGERYSCFAGFAEAGESLEDAVAREVGEEAGVRLRDIAYRGSQAWPYPRSLMLGFRAVVVDDAEAQADGDEIVEVRWFDRDEIGAALRGEGSTQLPGPASIARRLIDDWYRGVA
ncbi:NAD(+) diphosphatase [Microbacterium testaceum]|uniref:NAD(+) diphosphatase n=1 Tax=Microbacterium testaceum TaxID=2033 RepID=UPI001245BD32|nr:NAD(+) diphosphatase [Microbacterium testaceum]